MEQTKGRTRYGMIFFFMYVIDAFDCSSEIGVLSKIYLTQTDQCFKGMPWLTDEYEGTTV